MAVSTHIPSPKDLFPGAVEHVALDNGRVLLTSNGHPVAALVPVDDLRVLEGIDEAEDAHWSSAANEAIREWEAEGRPAGIPMEDIARELGIDLFDTP